MGSQRQSVGGALARLRQARSTRRQKQTHSLEINQRYGGQGRNRTADASLFRAAGFTSRGYAPRAWLAQSGARSRSLERSRFLVDQEFVVARDGIEPPTPAFSGLRSTN